MKKFLIVASLSALSALPSGCAGLLTLIPQSDKKPQAIERAEPQKSPEIKSTAGRFAVVAPTTLKEEAKPISTEVGNLTLNQLMGIKGDTAYIVAYTDYPAQHIQSVPADTLLEGAVSGVIQGLRGNLTSKTNTSLDGNPGKEFSMTVKYNGQDVTYRERAFLVKNRLYQLIATTPQSVNNPEIDSFMNSFRLLNN